MTESAEGAMTHEKSVEDLSLEKITEVFNQKSAEQNVLKFWEWRALKSLMAALRKYQNEIQRLSNIIRDEGWAIPDGTLRLGLVTAQEKIASLESTNSKLRDGLNYAYNHLHGTHHCNCDFIASKESEGGKP